MKHSGFSLMELAIVLVVIGLIAGGVVGGQALIRSSEIRSITADKDKYVSAIETFKERYSEYPGDFSKATKVWGAAHAVLNTCKTTAGTGTQTCDGDGDGRMGLQPVNTTWYEKYRSWQHLANAGLIEGSYTGTGYSGWSSVPGINVPVSKITGAGFSTMWLPPVGTGNFFSGKLGQTLFFGAARTGDVTLAPIITPDEAWSIDQKVDDGRPAYGILQALKSTSAITPNCTTTDVSTTAAYNVANTAKLCSIQFNLF